MKSPSGVNYSTANAHAGSPYQSAQQQQNAGNTKLALLSKSGGSKSGGNRRNRRNRRGGASQIQVSSGGNTLYKSVGGVTPNDIVTRNTVAGNAASVQAAGDIVPLAKPTMRGGSRLRKNKSRKNKSRKNKSRKNKSRKM